MRNLFLRLYRPLIFTIPLFLFLLLLSNTASAQSATKAKPGKTFRRWVPSTQFVETATPKAQYSLPVISVLAAPPQKSQSQAATSLKTIDTNASSKKILNLRIHPAYMASMLLSKDTILSLRGDLDFVLGGGVTLGPSVIYQSFSRWDEQAMSEGNSQVLDESFLEVGLISNIYLTGNTSTGGFIFRPHAYWIDPQGERVHSEETTAQATSIRNELRGGTEFIYQHIMPIGLNFEIGAGLSYYFIPQALDYPEGGARHTESSARLIPTISAAVGWAF